MNRRRTRLNWFRILLLGLLVAGGVYIDLYVIPSQPSPFVNTPTPTLPPESFITQAEDDFKQGKLTKAIEAYKNAIASRPDDPSVYVSLARVQVFAGNYKDAQTSAEDALLLNANNSMAHAVRGWALDFQGNYLDAETSIKRALELDPNNALAHAYYVEILVDSTYSGSGLFGGIEKAIEESKVAVALAPNALETHRARGYLLESTGNYEEAIREYQEAIKINPNLSDLHLALGRNYRILQIYDKAVEEFTRANALNPQDPTPDLYISRTYATIGEYAKAMQYAQTAVTDNPSDPALRGNLGVMYYRNLYWREAVKELGYVINGGLTDDGAKISSIPLSPDARVAEYYFTYGLALARLNQCGSALPIAQMILERVPSDELAVSNANEIISRCEQNLKATPTAEPGAQSATDTPMPPTPTPSPTSTP